MLVSKPPAEVRRLLALLAQATIAVQPTARVVLGESETLEWQLHPRLADVTPPEILQWLATQEGRWSQRALIELYEKNLHDQEHAPHEYSAALNQRVRAMLALYRESDVHVIFGSDTPAAEGPGNAPGLNGALEIHAWAEAGFTPNEILSALTLDNARAFGLAGEIGSLEVGKRADILVLKQDPRESAEAFDSIELVLVGGRLIPRAELSAR